MARPSDWYSGTDRKVLDHAYPEKSATHLKVQDLLVGLLSEEL